MDEVQLAARSYTTDHLEAMILASRTTSAAALRRSGPSLALSWSTPWVLSALKVILILVLPLAGAAAHAAAYLLLAAWALGRARRAIEALTLTWLITFLNPGIYNLSPQSDALRWVVIGAAFLAVSREALRRRSPV